PSRVTNSSATRRTTSAATRSRGTSTVRERDSRPMLVEPVQQLANAARGERNAGIGRAVVQIDRVAVGTQRVAAREGDVPDVPLALVRRFGTEDPCVAAQETVLRTVERQQGDAETIKTAGRRVPDAVIEHQPA